jgi:protein-tyrosine-phosphatase
MSLFHELRRRKAKVLFVCPATSGPKLLAEALARAKAGDVMEATSLGIALAILDLASFDVIVNLTAYAIPQQDGAYLLNLPVPDPTGQGDQVYQEALERLGQIVEFLAKHFRWAREWKFGDPIEEDEPQTKLVPTLIAVPPPDAARSASV